MLYQEAQGVGLNDLSSTFMSSVTPAKTMQIDSVVGNLKSKNKQQTKPETAYFW